MIRELLCGSLEVARGPQVGLMKLSFTKLYWTMIEIEREADSCVEVKD